MSKSAPSSTRRRPRRLSRRWHRWLGIMVVFPLLFVAVTGVLLNHTVALGLDQKPVRSIWVAKHYGFLPKGPIYESELGARKAYFCEDQLSWQGKLYSLQGTYLGGFQVPAGVAFVSSEQVLLLDSSGQELELMGEEALPPLPLEKATFEQGLVVVAAGKSYRFSEELIDYEPVAKEAFSFLVTVQELKASEASQIRPQFVGEMVSWNRFILDLHSGAFFGLFGKLVADFVVIMIVVLCISGIVLWVRPPRRNGSGS